MSVLKWTFFFFILVVAISFAIKNDQLVSLKYYFGWESLPLPLYLWAFLSLFIGLIVSGLLNSLSKVSLHAQIRQQKKAIVDLERKLEALKSKPPSP